MDLAELRARLGDRRGPEYWRSLEELARSPAFEQALARELPGWRSLWDQPLDRRAFLKLSAAALCMAGLAACTRQPPEQIVPYVRLPARSVMGEPLYYASTLSAADDAVGVLVETYEGRPLHLQGNPAHPASLGACDVFTQAAILDLYDPDRGQGVTAFGTLRDYPAFQTMWLERHQALAAKGGRGLHVLTPPLRSPAVSAELAALFQALPEARWYMHGPLDAPGVAEGARLAFGQPLETRYDFKKAAVVVALDADFLGSMPGALRYAADFMEARRAAAPNRLYAIESLTSLTGAKADHRLALRPSEIEAATRQLASALGLAVAGTDGPLPPAWLNALVQDLGRHPGRALIVPGPAQPAAVHALAHAMNARLNAPVAQFPSELPRTEAGLAELVAAIDAGAVDTLLILGGNPVYDAPAELGLAAALARVPLRIYYGPAPNETARLAHWYLPQAHALESWGDLRAFDGSASLIQPVVRPLFGGIEPLALLPDLRGEPGGSPLSRLREHWRRRYRGADFDTDWRRWLHDGVIPDSAPAPVSPPPCADLAQALPAPAASAPLELRYAPDPSVWDGRFANNAWLQELPKPLTKLVWGNALLISPALASDEDLASGDVVTLRAGQRDLALPIFVHPGQPARSMTLHLGYGREYAGRLGDGVGVSAYRLRSRSQPWFTAATIVKTGRREALVTTQHHHRMEGRNIVHTFTVDEVRRGERPPPRTPARSLYPPRDYPDYAWGMAIDLTACIGCNACVIACQSENNSPCVGKAQVALGREMHWLRIDRYYQGDIDTPKVALQPVPCMHCEQAPCEYACPVHATTHSSEGVNQMNYQRCIGTRDCSQNCPYKVRRFNWFDFNYEHPLTPAQDQAHNPEVTVRSRGVMEKCTYCIQRIDLGRTRAEIEGRRVRDGEIRTACQEACPTRAIVFGDLNDPDSEVARLKAGPLNYAMLAELNTRPRTSYLAGVRNPNPELDDGRR